MKLEICSPDKAVAMIQVESSRCNILIVDDVAKNIQVLGNILRQEGYSISFATSGKQALRMVAADSFDLILLDVMMPEMDGLEVCKGLKEDPESRHIPVIFLTAKTEREDIVKGFQVGALDYVTKPFNSAELLARVRTHLELKKARDRIARTLAELAEKNSRLTTLNEELQRALREIKTLEGFLPICSSCRRIRKKDQPPERQESWVPMEQYLDEHGGVKLTHSICPRCIRKLYPEFVIAEPDHG
jgi:PleD family two-component response regulator